MTMPDMTDGRTPPLADEYSRFKRVEAQPAVANVLAATLSSLVVGQEEAAQIVAREIVLSEAGMGDPTKPRAIFLFTGPTGVGKTEMTEAIAKVLYKGDWENHYQRINCGTLNSEGDVTKLIGGGPKWVGYGDPPLITKAFLEQEGGTVVVFDEAEKAHPEVWQALLSITDKGILPVFQPTTTQSRANNHSEVAAMDLKFHNTVLVFTSNAGSEEMQRARTGNHTIGFQVPRQTDRDVKAAALKGLKASFGSIPEFLGRIGERRMIVFNELQPDHYEQIFDLSLGELNSRIAGRVHVSDALKAWVIENAIGDGEYGARDLKHAISEHVVAPIAELRSSKTIQHNTEILADRTDDEIIFFEGDVIEDESSEEPFASAAQEKTKIPKSTVEFEYGTEFQIDPTEKGEPPKDGVVHEVELINNGKKKGRIKVGEVHVGTVGEIIIFHSDKRPYRMALELDRVVKADPNTIQIIIGDETYTSRSTFTTPKKGLSTMKVSSWQKGKDTKNRVDLVFSWEDLKEARFLIK